MPEHDHSHFGPDDAHDLCSSRRRSDGQSESPVLADATVIAAGAARRPEVLGGPGMLRLQRVAGNAAAVAATQDERSPVLDVVSGGGGQSLDGPLRAEMEGRLGADFSDVRLHTDAGAHESARAVGAHAYTVGNNVVFQRDAWDPDSHAGKTTIAHELTHVMQQRSGPVSGTPTGDGISVSDPSDSFEREAVSHAEHVMSTPASPAIASTSAAGGADASGAAVQREADADEPLQGMFVQRVDEEEDEQEPAPM